MKKLIFSALACALLAGCSTLDSSNEPTTTSVRSASEERVTGSRLPRSESNENYQGAKTMTRKDYEEYKASTGKPGGP